MALHICASKSVASSILSEFSSTVLSKTKWVFFSFALLLTPYTLLPESIPSTVHSVVYFPGSLSLLNLYHTLKKQQHSILESQGPSIPAVKWEIILQ